MPLDCSDSAALRVAPVKGPDPKLRNEFCPQVSHEDDETIEVFVWERIDEDAEDDAEDDGRRSDSKRQGDYGDQGESAICCEGAEA
jgi:hypothetical protein